MQQPIDLAEAREYRRSRMDWPADVPTSFEPYQSFWAGSEAECAYKLLRAMSASPEAGEQGGDRVVKVAEYLRRVKGGSASPRGMH